MLLLGPLFTHTDIERAAELIRSGTFVIAVDGGSDFARLGNLRVDYYIGDGDSATPEGLAYVGHVDGIRLPTTKDHTDFGIACTYAAEKGSKRITCIGFVGGRFDHQLALLGEAAKNNLDAEFLSDSCEIFLLGADSVMEVVGYTTFSVIALTENNAVSVSGAEWDLHEETLVPLSSRGVSNTGDAHVHVHSGRVIVVAYV